MSNIKDMIETILITEVTKLYNSASTSIGLTSEETRKLEVFVKVLKDFDTLHNNVKRVKSKPQSIEKLLKIIEETNIPNE